MSDLCQLLYGNRFGMMFLYISCLLYTSLLWSNWCEYKKSLGVEFGEYSLRQYRYAKEYYRIVKEELSQIKGAKNHE